MTGKRALIVDDSKSARSFLSRILEGYALEVDTVESAEEAIEYLTRHIPDVIFMDHLMPGMDGFQAVQTIKNNPRTATIPIMMYTSQEGELYLGQARALGAIGVLPKQIKPADVSKVLYQLHLVQDRRTAAQETFQPVPPDDLPAPTHSTDGPNMPAEVALAASSSSPAVVNEMLVRDQISELRRFVVSNLEQQSERIMEQLRDILRDMQIAAPPPAPLPPEPTEPARPSAAWAIAAVAVLTAVAMAGLWRGEMLARESLQERLAPAGAVAQGPAAAEAPIAATAPIDDVPLATTAAAALAENASVVHTVPYGEPPLAGARVELARDVLAQLLGRGFRGVVNVATYPGRFCLSGNAAEGYSLAPEDVRFENCDLLSNPAEDAQRESLAFANMIADMRKRAAGALDIHVGSGGGDGLAMPYPRITGTLTAGEWNAAAAANNRVEIRWRPRS